MASNAFQPGGFQEGAVRADEFNLSSRGSLEREGRRKLDRIRRPKSPLPNSSDRH